ncbi:unnamed protein product [Blepharisma stoltei]|uniref:Uncharacterized protein n=1 Tax=Blepharisma stoltei TaxID=1481888 RepID=A0AAU9IHZ7_9CILI|nr:unnamed protein product [Blepharisma stoltei]
MKKNQSLKGGVWEFLSNNCLAHLKLIPKALQSHFLIQLNVSKRMLGLLLCFDYSFVKHLRIAFLSL